MTAGAYHEPVLTKEVLEYLAPAPGMIVVDATMGHGGHAMHILKQLGAEGLYVGIDTDPLSIETARKRIESFRIVPTPCKFILGNHGDLHSLLQHAQIAPSHRILCDLGPSTPQLLDPRLGMSWESDEALDMRLHRGAEGVSAAEVVGSWSEERLARLFRETADERWSSRIAQRIVAERAKKPIQTGRQLGDIIAASIPRRAWPRRLHPATRTFMALRMLVNNELENLEAFLPQAFEALAPGGRLAVIGFHSGHDAPVKSFMRMMARPEVEAPFPLPQRGNEIGPRLKILTRKPVRPSEEEIRRNPASRSARLRVAEKIR